MYINLNKIIWLLVICGYQVSCKSQDDKNTEINADDKPIVCTHQSSDKSQDDKNTEINADDKSTVCTYQSLDKSQDDKNTEINVNNKTIVMKKLNITEFEKSKANESGELIIGDSLCRYYKTYDGNIGRSSMKLDENYKSLEVYDKKSLTLVRTGQVFFDTPIGIHREYNSKGELVKETDYDKDFKLSLNDIISLVKEKIKADINKKGQVSHLTRRFDEDRNKYIYYIVVRINDSGCRDVIIDAENGEIIYDERGFFID